MTAKVSSQSLYNAIYSIKTSRTRNITCFSISL